MLRKLFIILFLFVCSFSYSQSDDLFMYSNKFAFVEEYKIKNKILPDNYTYSMTTFKLTNKRFHVLLPDNVKLEYDILDSAVYDNHVVIQSVTATNNTVYFSIYENFISVVVSGKEGMWLFVLTKNID